jgi:hypothetical protein
VAAALVGEQDRVAQQLLRLDGAGVAGLGVIALVDEQDRGRASGGPSRLLPGVVRERLPA